MTETLTGTNRSAGPAYDELLDADTRPVPEHLRRVSSLDLAPTQVPVECYTSREFHDLEVERLWKRVWQLAGHEDDIPDVGDYLVYDVAELSFLVVRTEPDAFKAYWNACLHRGRLLRDGGGKRAKDLRCSFHGWCWNLDGSSKEIPCEWDFEGADVRDQSLPEVRIGRWGGFLFINPDPDAEPIADFFGDLEEHFTTLPYERRYKEAHVAKVLRCNWKVAQEAFMEAYHVVATHPQILGTIGDANSKYDAFTHYSRAISPNAVPSPHLVGMPEWDVLPDAGPQLLRHPLSGTVYGRVDDGLVEATATDGRAGIFRADGTWVDGELGEADPQMCNWVGGAVLPPPAQASSTGAAADARRAFAARAGAQSELSPRAAAAERVRDHLREQTGTMIDDVCDAELVDSIYFTVFPNWHPWGAFNRIVYRFRPHGNNPDESIMECMYFAPAPEGKPRPEAAPIHWLDVDDDWTEAPELGMLAKVFNQDTYNLPSVQRGLHTTSREFVQFGDYGETKIRHFHQVLAEFLARE